jgi:ADP-heptose:LPS heptosyltransferase
VTRPKFAPFFYDIERVIAFPADVDYTFNGVFGMRDLFRTLIRKGDFEVVVDMHDHIRTVVLRTLFKLFGTPIVVVKKGRSEKKLFTQKDNKVDVPLRHTVIRYQQALEEAGFSFTLHEPPYFVLNDSLIAAANEWLAQKNLQKKEKWIGIAPFTMHASKTWPLENYSTVIRQTIEKSDAKFFLFGGGSREVKFFESLEQEFPGKVFVAAGQLKIRQEIALIQQLDLMLCTDSSNMHLAALSGVPVLSIWGGTHPDVGFGPFKATPDSVIQISRAELPCRPCSVYGRDTCYIGGFPCLTRITAEQISNKISDRLK